MDSKALYRKYFKRMPDDSIHFLGEKLIIQIPEGFVERGITKIIQTTVNTIGIFEGYISDNVDEEDVSKKYYDKSRRVYRGLFISNNGIKINSDVNGSLQIMKKVFPNAFSHGIEDYGFNPIRVDL